MHAPSPLCAWGLGERGLGAGEGSSGSTVFPYTSCSVASVCFRRVLTREGLFRRARRGKQEAGFCWFGVLFAFICLITDVPTGEFFLLVSRNMIKA